MAFAKDNLAQASLLIALPPEGINGPSTRLKVGVYSNGKRLNTVSTVFAGPRTSSTEKSK